MQKNDSFLFSSADFVDFRVSSAPQKSAKMLISGAKFGEKRAKTD